MCAFVKIGGNCINNCCSKAIDEVSDFSVKARFFQEADFLR